MTGNLNFWVSCLVWLAGLSGWFSSVTLTLRNTVRAPSPIKPCMSVSVGAGMGTWTETGTKSPTPITMTSTGRMSVLALKLVTTKVSLATALGFSMCCFVSGIIVRDYWKEKAHDTYAAGYQARDVEAYSRFVNRPQVHWKIVNSYPANKYKGTAYDIELVSGQIARNFVPCEDPGWYIGLVITGVGYYNRGSCMSFLGPQAYTLTELKTPELLQTKGQTQTQ